MYYIKMKSYWIKVGPKSMTGVLTGTHVGKKAR